MTGKTNLAELMSFKEETDNPKGDSTSNWMRIKLPEGEAEKKYTLRILPPIEGEGLPFYKERVHYFRVGGKTIAGAVDTTSPANDLYWKVSRTVWDSGNKALYNTIRQLQLKDRYYFNVVDRETGSIKILSLPKKAFDMILDALNTAAEYGQDLTDDETGKDIILKVVSVEGAAPFTYASATAVPVETPVDVPGWEGMLHDLKASARSTVLSEDEISDLIPDLLGDHYEEIMGIYEVNK